MDEAQTTYPLFKDMVDLFEEHKENVIQDIERQVRPYFVDKGLRPCFDLVEIRQTRDTDGSVTAELVYTHPFSFSWSFFTRLRTFMWQQQGASDASEREFIDSAHTRSIQKIVKNRFMQLYASASAEVASCFLHSQLQDAQKCGRLCSYFRERVRSSVMPFTEQQRVALSSLSDEDIIQKGLQLGNDSNERNYMRAVAFLEEHIYEPSRRVQDDAPPANLGISEALGHSGPFFESGFVQMIVAHQFFLLLLSVPSIGVLTGSMIFVAFPAVFAYSLAQLSSFPAQLGSNVAKAISDDLELSFKERNIKILAAICLGDTDSILQKLVEVLLPPDSSAEIVDRVILPSPEVLAVLAKNDRSVVEELVSKDINAIAIGRYSWLKELEGLGVSAADMAELLLDEYNESPWVFDKEVEAISKPQASKPIFNHHFPGCVHHSPWGGKDVSPTDSTHSLSPGVSSGSFQDMDIASKLHSRCGLAGVAPISARNELWNGTISFVQGGNGTAALVAFNNPADDLSHILRRIIVALCKVVCLRKYACFCRRHT